MSLAPSDNGKSNCRLRTKNADVNDNADEIIMNHDCFKLNLTVFFYQL